MMLKWPRNPKSIRCSRIARTAQFRPSVICYSLPLIVDDSIEAQPEVYMEAGDHETLLHINHAQFARLMGNARHGRFSERLTNGISSSVVWG